MTLPEPGLVDPVFRALFKEISSLDRVLSSLWLSAERIAVMKNISTLFLSRLNERLTPFLTSPILRQRLRTNIEFIQSSTRAGDALDLDQCRKLDIFLQ